MKRSVALVLLVVGLVRPCLAPAAPAQTGAGAEKVRVTLVRWPYT